MWIEILETHNFRNLIDGQIHFESGLNWLYGSNGQGKTNCLQAAYFSLTGKSFRTSNNRDLHRNSSEETRFRARVLKGTSHWEYGVNLGKGKTTRQLGGKNCKSLDFFKSCSIISFTARSKNMVEGSPDDRRRFIDRMISCCEPEYMLLLSKYRKIHGQVRQALLSRTDLGVYRGFKTILAPVAKAIVDKRKNFLESVRSEANDLFRNVFNGEGSLHLDYQVRGSKALSEYENRIIDVSASEMLHGKSLMGPHLDDLTISIEENKARRIASSGQVRAIVLATKLAVRDSYFRRFGYYPILLLDDIDAELDPERLNGLLSYLNERGQCLISTSKYATMEAHLEGCIYVVNAGRMSPPRKGE